MKWESHTAESLPQWSSQPSCSLIVNQGDGFNRDPWILHAQTPRDSRLWKLDPWLVTRMLEFCKSLRPLSAPSVTFAKSQALSLFPLLAKPHLVFSARVTFSQVPLYILPILTSGHHGPFVLNPSTAAVCCAVLRSQTPQSHWLDSEQPKHEDYKGCWRKNEWTQARQQCTAHMRQEPGLGEKSQKFFRRLGSSVSSWEHLVASIRQTLSIQGGGG